MEDLVNAINTTKIAVDKARSSTGKGNKKYALIQEQLEDMLAAIRKETGNQSSSSHGSSCKIVDEADKSVEVATESPQKRSMRHKKPLLEESASKVSREAKCEASKRRKEKQAGQQKLTLKINDEVCVPKRGRRRKIDINKSIEKINRSREKSNELNKTEQSSTASRNQLNTTMNTTIATKTNVKLNHKGETALHAKCVAADYEGVCELLSMGMDCNTSDFAGWSPLHEAVGNNSIKIVEALLRAGALVDVPGLGYITPLHEAVKNKYIDIAVLLVKYGADLNAADKKGVKPLQLADEEMMKALASVKNEHQDIYNEFLAKRRRDESINLNVYPVNLKTEIMEKLKDLSKKHDNVKIFNEFKKPVSHFLLESEIGNVTREMLLAVVAGRWIIDCDWIKQCTAESLHPVDDFIVENIGAKANGALTSCISRIKRRPRLFDGCHFYIHGFNKEFEISRSLKVDKKFLTRLIVEGGGTVLRREPNPEGIPEKELGSPFHAKEGSSLERCCHFILYGLELPSIIYNMSHLKAVTVGWLVESIQNATLVSP